MKDMQNFVELGKKIYNLNNVREAHRFVVFVTRCTFNVGKMRKIIKFFQSSELLSRVAETFPFVYEQPTRAFFYNRSTFEERINLIEEHMTFLQTNLKSETVKDIYSNKPLKLWQMDLDDEFKSMELIMSIESGQRKEGLLSLLLRLKNNKPLYQIMFWIAKDKSNDWAMWIGALQGPNMDDAKEVVKKITKKCHAYRTKNLILYAAQAVSRNLGLKKIYAVTNEGYYANNHVRIDRKLKTSFSDFWLEAGGSHTDDERFDILPLTEARKSADEIPTRKRAVYRRRFALLDEIDLTIESKIKEILIK